jgi:hypothetical protein
MLGSKLGRGVLFSEAQRGAPKIALAHLNEFPDYYIRLARMEEEAKVFWQEEAQVAPPDNPLPS